jgi:hypothetical protein
VDFSAGDGDGEGHKEHDLEEDAEGAAQATLNRALIEP